MLELFSNRLGLFNNSFSNSWRYNASLGIQQHHVFIGVRRIEDLIEIKSLRDRISASNEIAVGRTTRIG